MIWIILFSSTKINILITTVTTANFLISYKFRGSNYLRFDGASGQVYLTRLVGGGTKPKHIAYQDQGWVWMMAISVPNPIRFDTNLILADRTVIAVTSIMPETTDNRSHGWNWAGPIIKPIQFSGQALAQPGSARTRSSPALTRSRNNPSKE